MKKLIAMICLIMFSLTLGSSKSDKETYVKVTQKDTLTVSIVAENQKQLASTDNLNLQVGQLVENQNTLTTGLVASFDAFTKSAIDIVKIIEERNKSDGIVVMSNYNYTTAEVLRIVKREKALLLITFFIVLLYIIWVRLDRGWNKLLPVNAWIAKLIFYVGLGGLVYYTVLKLLTLTFNGDYYVLKELITLYK